MSAVARLDDTIRAIADSQYPEGVTTAWVVIAAVHQEGEDGTAFAVMTPDGQPAYSTVGLMHIGLHEGVTEP